jgi:quercetin dioxygenase-like cupin family protein
MALDARVGQKCKESIRSGKVEAVELARGVWLREFVSKSCGACEFSTASATFEGGAILSYHRHPCSEAITVLSGVARIGIEGRYYTLEAFDCLHVPAGVAHQVSNASQSSALFALSAFAADEVKRELVDKTFRAEERGSNNPSARDPEFIVRFAEAEIYLLSEGAEFRDLFAGRFGAVGICGGYGLFQPGSSLPCHVHQYDESITIIEGEAVCLVQGARYLLSGYDTAFVPQGRPHRFLNQSDSPMGMLWVYAGSEPERTLVDASYCDAAVAWTGQPSNI